MRCYYACSQSTDARGRVNAKVRHELLQLTLDVPEDDTLLAWAAAPFKALAGEVVFYHVTQQVAHETIAFAAGQCVAYHETFVSGAGRDGAYVCQLSIAAPSFELRAGGPAAAVAVSTVAIGGPLKAAITPVLAATAIGGAPATPANYLTTPMDPDYIGEETGAVWGTQVKYLSAEERKAYQLGIGKDGLLYDANSKLFDTHSAGTVTSKGKAIFVMAASGEMYASMDHQPGLFHHSSFLAGEPVAAAGEIEVLAGVITSVSNRSGHYTPDQSYTHQFVEQLWRGGLKNTAQIRIDDFSH